MIALRAKPPELLHLSFLCFLFEMEGEAASRAGNPVCLNPYESGTRENGLWRAGWATCRAFRCLDGPLASQSS